MFENRPINFPPREMVIAYWPRYFTKLAINREEITQLIQSFQLYFCLLRPIFTLVKVLNKQITMPENIPPQRREVVVSENGNCTFLPSYCSLEG